MKKKALALALALGLTLSMTSCSSKESESSEPVESSQVPEIEAKFTAGTYSATEQGNNGPVTLSVTFSDDSITDISVVESTETKGLGTVATDDLIDAILDGQTLAVDAISGATNTSNAVIAIVKNCVEQAGGKVDDLMVKNTAAGGEETLTTELLIVGGGGSGMTAAIRAAQAGTQVLLIEKQSFTGGATAISGGGMVTTCSQLQKDLGVEGDDPESMVKDFQLNGEGKNNVTLLTLYSENVGSTVDWLIEKAGIKFNTEKGISASAEYEYPRVVSFEGGAAGVGQMLRAAVDAAGVTVMTNTRAEHILMDDGVVTGVEAFGSNGTKYTIKADNVILATGGFGNNKDMLPDSLKNVLYYGPVASTGDGHKMAEELGAGFQNMEYGKIYPNGVEVSPGIAKSTVYGTTYSCSSNAILVNADGERVVDERASYNNIKKVQLAQEGQTLYLVMDADTFENTFCQNLAISGITPEEIDAWLEANGSSYPIFAHGDTLEEAAKAAGVNGETLKATEERFNSMVRDGHEDKDFGRLADYMQKEIGAGPYYIVEQKPRFATTMGGVTTSTSMELLNANGDVIPHIYACGELVGGVMGTDSPPGANIGWAFTSGRLAADAVLSAK